jgi:hypothetical protein
MCRWFQRVHRKPHHAPLFAAELHPDQMDGLPGGAVAVGIALILDLLEGAAFRFQLHYLELEQIDLAIEAQRQIQPVGVAALLQGQIQPQAGEIGIEDAGVVALVGGNGIVAKPIVGNAGEEGGSLAITLIRTMTTTGATMASIIARWPVTPTRPTTMAMAWGMPATPCIAAVRPVRSFSPGSASAVDPMTSSLGPA